MNALAFARELALLAPHVAVVALIAARLLPVTFLCPLFGGAQLPMSVRLGLVLTLSLCVHLSGGIETPVAIDSLGYVASAAKELTLGTTLGLIASLPFDAARMSGRFIDTFRGSSAEAALPLAGSREAATGELLYQLLLALASAGFAFPLVVSALFKSFTLVPLGVLAGASDAVAVRVASLVGASFAVGLALGAPVAGTSLAVDAALGLASRAAPNMGLQEAGTPFKLLAGAAVTWLMVSLVAQRLLALACASHDSMLDVLRVASVP